VKKTIKGKVKRARRNCLLRNNKKSLQTPCAYPGAKERDGKKRKPVQLWETVSGPVGERILSFRSKKGGAIKQEKTHNEKKARKLVFTG